MRLDLLDVGSLIVEEAATSADSNNHRHIEFILQFSIGVASSVMFRD